MVIDFKKKKSLNCRPTHPGRLAAIFFHRLVSLFTKSSNNYGGGDGGARRAPFLPKSWLALSQKFFQ